jgi:hypothetical protein
MSQVMCSGEGFSLLFKPPFLKKARAPLGHLCFVGRFVCSDVPFTSDNRAFMAELQTGHATIKCLSTAVDILSKQGVRPDSSSLKKMMNHAMLLHGLSPKAPLVRQASVHGSVYVCVSACVCAGCVYARVYVCACVHVCLCLCACVRVCVRVTVVCTGGRAL